MELLAVLARLKDQTVLIRHLILKLQPEAAAAADLDLPLLVSKQVLMVDLAGALLAAVLDQIAAGPEHQVKVARAAMRQPLRQISGQEVAAARVLLVALAEIQPEALAVLV